MRCVSVEWLELHSNRHFVFAVIFRKLVAVVTREEGAEAAGVYRNGEGSKS